MPRVPREPEWIVVSGSDRRALDVVDGRGAFEGMGEHYSRRTRDAKTFTGCGQELVLLHRSLRAVWACVYQRTPAAPGTGASRGRAGMTDVKPRYIWRNMLFRNLGGGLSSDLIRSATATTYHEWRKKYGTLPPERLRTEVDVRRVKSKNPGFCYIAAGWDKGKVVRAKRYLYAPEREPTAPPGPEERP